MFDNKETPQHILQAFLSINDEMNDAIRSVEHKTSPEEYKAFKRGVGYVMYEVFDKIVEPICKWHPSLKAAEMEG